MALVPITLYVDEQAARIFNAASPDERRKLEALISLQLLDVAARPAGSLQEIMHRISDRAKERGLTEEKLQELLDDVQS